MQPDAEDAGNVGGNLAGSKVSPKPPSKDFYIITSHLILIAPLSLWFFIVLRILFSMIFYLLFLE
jgi:hypothetical protein